MKILLSSIGQPVARLGNIRMLFCAAALVALATPAARASDPTGIYAIVERIVFEPNESAPERIQVWGGFALAKKSANNSEYHDAERGYMYFKLRPGAEDVCKKEWADLKSIAGTRQIVAFGSRYTDQPPTARKPDAKVENPDLYPKSWGMTKVRPREYAPLTQLEKLMKESPPAKPAPAPASNSAAKGAASR